MTQTRFVVKWNNGFWKVFDTEEYKDVEKCYLGRDARELCSHFNGKAYNANA